MDQDRDQLRLLSLFHYVVGGLMGLCSLFPAIYVVLGLVMVFNPGSMDKGNPPPPLVGWMFIVIGAVGILVGLTLAVLTLVAGRRLAKYRSHTFCLVVAGLLFVIGFTGVLVRRNTLVIYMSLELMLNASTLAAVSFSRYNGSSDGNLLVFFIITVAAAEVAVGLAIIVALFRKRHTVQVDELGLLKN